MKVILLGPPGSGKGTVSKKLIEQFNFDYFSTGDMFRAAIKNQTELGLKVKKILDDGGLVSDELTVELVRTKLEGKEHYILDGFPRTIAQADAIDKEGIDLVLLLDVPEHIVVKRISGRRLDPHTGKFYHIEYIPAPEDVKERLIQRDDDKEHVVKNRFSEYEAKTAPLIKYYQEKGILVPIDGTKSPEDVFEDAKRVIEEFLK